MMIGQMSFKGVSNKSDYIQLDICGLSKEEALDKYKQYKTDKPIILHGDWTKKGASENNIKERHNDYIDIINSLKNETNVLGITIHPPFRKKVSLEDFTYICDDIFNKTGVIVFVENRSNNRIHLSVPEEIIDYSKSHLMTIDIPQLYISCGYDEENLIKTLKAINMDNVKEIHFANILRKEKNTFVARKIDDGELDLKEILNYLPSNAYYTLEILGQIKTFDEMYDSLKYMKKNNNIL